MNPATLGLARFVRDLLGQPEFTVVQIGRNNFRRDDYDALQIIIDNLGPAVRLNSSEKYDGDAEIMTYAQQWRAPCTVDFYGDEAYDQAQKFILTCQSQAGYELQLQHGVTIYEASQITDVKWLTGEQYSARYQVSLQVQYTISADVETLRIDEAQTDIITDADYLHPSVDVNP